MLPTQAQPLAVQQLFVQTPRGLVSVHDLSAEELQNLDWFSDLVSNVKNGVQDAAGKINNFVHDAQHVIGDVSGKVNNFVEKAAPVVQQVTNTVQDVSQKVASHTQNFQDFTQGQ